MSNSRYTDPAGEFDLRLASSDTYAEENYGAFPVVDDHDALDAYHAWDDGLLAEAPHALAAYLGRQRFHDV